MLCVNAPRKPMARIHLLISLVLVIVCAVLAFTPLIKIRVTEETADQIENLMEYILEKVDDSEENAEIKAKAKKIVDSLDLEDASVTLSITGFAASTQPLTDAGEALADFISAAMEANKSGGSSEEAEEKGMAALETLKTVFLTEDDEIRPEVKDLVVVIAAIAGPMLPSGSDIESGMSEENIGGMVANAAPHLISLVLAMILAFLIPVIYVILAIVTLIVGLTNLKEPDIGAAKLAKRMPKSIVHPLSVMLVCCLSATLEYTASTLILAVLAGVGTLINVIFTRLHSWDKQDLAYANVVQFTSLVSIGAFLFFFLNVLKMGVFSSFFGKFVSAVASGATPSNDAYTDVALIVLAAIFALCSTRYLAKVGRRVSLACTPKKKGGARCTHLVYALFLFVVTIAPMQVLGSTANDGASFLTATPAQEYALLYGFIATGIMVLSEIALLILRKVFGKSLTPAAKADVLSGVSLGPDGEAVAPAVEEAAPAKTSEEAPAENPEIEELPAEQPVEDTPAADDADDGLEEIKSEDTDPDAPND